MNNWSQKQGVVFNEIKSKTEIRKAREREKDLYGIICVVSSEFTYYYLNDPLKTNTFRLGTYHYLNLKDEGDRYIITKEWYTDPFADSLDLNNIKSDEIKSYILNSSSPSYSPDERTQKAIDYAHTYCGAAADDELGFNYNKNTQTLTLKEEIVQTLPLKFFLKVVDLRKIQHGTILMVKVLRLG